MEHRSRKEHGTTVHFHDCYGALLHMLKCEGAVGITSEINFCGDFGGSLNYKNYSEKRKKAWLL